MFFTILFSTLIASFGQGIGECVESHSTVIPGHIITIQKNDVQTHCVCVICTVCVMCSIMFSVLSFGLSFNKESDEMLAEASI